MTVQIVTPGRKDVDDFFKLSDVFTAERLNHTPLIVFIAIADAIQVRLLDHAHELLAFPDATPVMGQWRGSANAGGRRLAMPHRKDWKRGVSTKMAIPITLTASATCVPASARQVVLVHC